MVSACQPTLLSYRLCVCMSSHAFSPVLCHSSASHRFHHGCKQSCTVAGSVLPLVAIVLFLEVLLMLASHFIVRSAPNSMSFVLLTSSSLLSLMLLAELVTIFAFYHTRYSPFHTICLNAYSPSNYVLLLSTSDTATLHT